MPLSTPVITEAEEIDPDVTGTAKFIRVKWTDPAYGTGNAATGFKVMHDDADGSLPAWTSSLDAKTAGGGNGAGAFEVLVPVPLGGQAIYWESFSQYPTGVQSVAMDKGCASRWNGAWASIKSIEADGGSEDFGSYTAGVQSSAMNGGRGFDGAWVEIGAL